jgi:hypothetical protein
MRELMPKWVHMIVDLNNVPAKSSDVALLAELGQERWELVVIAPNKVAYLKRPNRRAGFALKACSSTNRTSNAEPVTILADNTAEGICYRPRLHTFSPHPNRDLSDASKTDMRGLLLCTH